MNNKVIAGVVIAVVFFLIGYGVRSSIDRSSQEGQQAESNSSGESLTIEGESQEPIKIGFISPLSGDAATLGQGARAGVELAVQEINETGGINGRVVEVIYEDGQCNGKEASTAAAKLISNDKVIAIIGGLCSAETVPAAAIAEENKITEISPCSSSPAVTKAGDYIFRVYPSDLFQGQFAAEYMFNTLNVRKVAVLFTQDDWGQGIKDVFVQRFSGLGGEVIVQEGFTKEARDLRTQLTKIKSSNPDALYFVGFNEASIPGIKQIRELEINVPVFGGDAWDDPSLWSGVGSDGDGMMYSVVSSPMNDSFKTKILARTGGNDVPLCTSQSYDIMKILEQVIGRVGTDSTDIKNALYDTVYTGGVSSDRIAFDENGDVIGAKYIVKVVKDGVASEKK